MSDQIRGMYIEKVRLAVELLCTISASGLPEVEQADREELSRAIAALNRVQHKLRAAKNPKEA